jgi:oligopeptide/dipeptide ABC transporter ATP-binding protein
MPESDGPLLKIENLHTHFRTDAGIARAVDGVSLELDPGKTMALVGESGCGKSVTALSVLGVIPQPPGFHPAGSVRFEGRELFRLNEEEMHRIRGNRISMIFQEPMSSLNPVFRVGAQVADVMRLHLGLSWGEALGRAVHLFQSVGIPAPHARIDDYPHQLSGGMRQRVMIAMALACDPALLIADEPTTALDVTIQAQILDLLRKLQAEKGMALLLITHDLGMVAEMAEEVAIMYAGKIVERARTRDLFRAPKHPYTVGLFESLPKMHRPGQRLHTIAGAVPAATRFPKGCRFHPRCPYAVEVCAREEPPLREHAPGHRAGCWLHHEEVMRPLGRPAGLPERETAPA